MIESFILKIMRIKGEFAAEAARERQLQAYKRMVEKEKGRMYTRGGNLSDIRWSVMNDPNRW